MYFLGGGETASKKKVGGRYDHFFYLLGVSKIYRKRFESSGVGLPGG